MSGACYECEDGFYSFEEDGNICKECPSGAICKGGTNVYPKYKYWRFDWDSEKFYECPVLDT